MKNWQAIGVLALVIAGGTIEAKAADVAAVVFSTNPQLNKDHHEETTVKYRYINAVHRNVGIAADRV